MLLSIMLLQHPRTHSVNASKALEDDEFLEESEGSSDADGTTDERPSILWITIEDWSADLSCYGTKGIRTPHVDKVAQQGIRQSSCTERVSSVKRSRTESLSFQRGVEWGTHMMPCAPLDPTTTS